MVFYPAADPTIYPNQITLVGGQPDPHPVGSPTRLALWQDNLTLLLTLIESHMAALWQSSLIVTYACSILDFKNTQILIPLTLAFAWPNLAFRSTFLDCYDDEILRADTRCTDC